MRVPGFARLYISLLLGRLAGSMLAVTLILFVLARYHSPQLAGLTAFVAIFPGLVVSPIAGALLDRHGRARLIVLDYVIAALTVFLVAFLSVRNALPPPLLLVIVAISSLTNPLSSTGVRSLFPIVAPQHLWERANALDSSGYLISALVGAPLAGSLVGGIGPEWALAATGAGFAIAASTMIRVNDPSTRSSGDEAILTQAWRGLIYVVRNASLRGLALTLGTYNVSWGILEIAIPVLVLGRLQQGPATVGFLWGLMGAAGLVSALFAGRIKSQGRERQMILGAMLIGSAAMASLPFARTVPMVAVAIIAVGLANGPFDIGLFTLRQRRTDPAWFGRAFAVSMSLNYAGTPIGSALAGPLIGWSLDAALWAAVIIGLAAAVFPMLTIPRDDAADASSGRALRSL
jgi:MFS family permease